MKASTDEYVAVLVQKVPRDVRERFKALCTLRRVGMSEEIVRLMAEAGKPLEAVEDPHVVRG